MYGHLYPKPIFHRLKLKSSENVVHELLDNLTRLHEPDIPLSPLAPTETQEQQQQTAQEFIQVQVGDNMICRNWGCINNTWDNCYEHTEDLQQVQTQCDYHSGYFQPANSQGLWPEAWSCCGKPWDTKGCKQGPHKGVRRDFFLHTCLNDGADSEETYGKGKRRQICGMSFTKAQLKAKNLPECEFNSDSTKKNHCFYAWPDENAKKFFLEVKNIQTLKRGDEEKKDMRISTQGKHSMFYRSIKDYEQFVSKETMLKKELDDDTKKETRICLHHGCRSKQSVFYKFTQFDSQAQQKAGRKGNCWKHTGVFDLGQIGVSDVTTNLASNLTNTFRFGDLNDFLSPDMDKEKSTQRVKWGPQWTCCRQKWFSKGCTQTWHSGPLLNDVLEEEKIPQQLEKYKWPNPDSIKRFHKLNSYHFQQGKLVRIMDIDEANEFYLQYIRPEDDLLKIAQKFKLPLLALSQDISYHFKLMDLLKGRVSAKVEEGCQVNREKFLNWLYTPLENYDVSCYVNEELL